MIEIKTNSEQVKRAIDRLVANVKNLRPAFNEIGEHLLATTRARFDTGTAPDGTKWQENSKATMDALIATGQKYDKHGLRAVNEYGDNLHKYRNRHGELNKRGNELLANKRPLIGETKQLMRQLSYQSRPDQLLFGSSMEYAAMHQFGGTKAQFPNLWGDIPARPFLGITAHDETVIEEIVEDEIMRGV
ncbi:MAG: phage virion morphogenesis protein [Alphaproteobacteria bacterium]|nr:phage virion morphogenesis protein [Alphaproteobacteria bacterium]